MLGPWSSGPIYSCLASLLTFLGGWAQASRTLGRTWPPPFYSFPATSAITICPHWDLGLRTQHGIDEPFPGLTVPWFRLATWQERASPHPRFSTYDSRRRGWGTIGSHPVTTVGVAGPWEGDVLA